jgi:hypothetical protein
MEVVAHVASVVVPAELAVMAKLVYGVDVGCGAALNLDCGLLCMNNGVEGSPMGTVLKALHLCSHQRSSRIHEMIELCYCIL